MDWPPHVTTAQKTAVLKCHFKTAVDLFITFGYANMRLFKRRFFLCRLTGCLFLFHPFFTGNYILPRNSHKVLTIPSQYYHTHRKFRQNSG